MPKITNNISIVIDQLKNDEVVAIPTETVYGLSANINSKKGIEKIFSIKKRPLSNPLIVHIKSIDSINEVAKNIPPIALELAKSFWPGPMTLILEKQDAVSSVITSGGSRVGVRVPDHPITLQLLNQINFPLAAPSANPFGRISPTTADHVISLFDNDFQYVLDGGACEHGIESTIIGFENNQPIIYRLGSLSIEKIEKIAGKTTLLNEAEGEKVNFPGMLTKHYAPITPLIFTENISASIKENAGKKIGLLLFKNEIKNKNIENQELLSKKGNLIEAAFGLYLSLHALDNLKLDLIIAEKFPNKDLGKAINDKLLRASNR